MDDPCRQCDGKKERDVFIANPNNPISDFGKSNGNFVLEQALRESEERYRCIFNAINEGIVVGDLHTSAIRYVNPALCKMLGYTEQEMTQMSAVDLHPDTETPKVFDFLQNLREEHTSSMQVRCICKDGTLREVMATGTLVKIDGQLLAVAFATDITEQLKQEQELKASQERFKRLADASFEAIVIHQDGTLIDVNQQYLDLFGYTLGEFKQVPGIEMIAPQSRALVKEKMASKYEGVYEAFGIKKDGTIFPIEIQARETVLNSQNIRIGAIRDLTEQQRLKRELKARDQRYRELYNNAQVALFVTDLNGVLLDCNLSTLDLFGYSRDEKKENYINKICVTDYYTDKERRKEFLSDLLKYRQVRNFEAELKRADGTLFWVSISAGLSLQAGTIEGALYDITASKVLTDMEKKILDIILKGKSNREIAKILNRSIRTIEDHRAHIMQKLNAHNLVELVQKGQTFIPQ